MSAIQPSTGPCTWNHKHITVPYIQNHTQPFLNTGCTPIKTAVPHEQKLKSSTQSSDSTCVLLLDVRVRCAELLHTIGITNPTIRVDVHNRITLPMGFVDMEAYVAMNPPMVTIPLNHPSLPEHCTSRAFATDESGDLIIEGLRVPVAIPCTLAPDAMVSVQYLATKNPVDHILAAGQSLLAPDPGRDILYGFVLLPLEDLLRGDRLLANLYPTGRNQASERVIFASDVDTLCSVVGQLQDARKVRRRTSVQMAAAGYLDILANADEIAAIASNNEYEMTHELMQMGSTQCIPEAVMCWMHMMMTESDSIAAPADKRARDGLFLNGHYFNMLPHPQSPFHFGADVVVGLLHMALVARHTKEPWLFLQLPSTLLDAGDRAALQTAPHLCAAFTMFDLEMKRLSLNVTAGVHDSLMDLALMAGACLIRHGTYCPDEAIVIEEAAPACYAVSGRGAKYRPSVVSSDYYSGWEGSDSGFRGDCEDKQAAIVMLLSYIEHDGDNMSKRHPLISHMVEACRHYLFLTAVGTAHAARLGESSVKASKTGGAVRAKVQIVDGVRVGIQGHVLALVVPRELLLEAAVVPPARFQGVEQVHALVGIGEGTTAQDSRNRPDPNPGPEQALIDAMYKLNHLALDLLGLTSAALWTFAPTKLTDVGFYDAVSTTVGVHLHGITDTSEKGAGRRITSAAVTMIDVDGVRRVGVPMAVLQDPSLRKHSGVQLTPIGWETYENLEHMASVNMMMPPRVVPMASKQPGIRANLADIPRHLHVLHRDTQQATGVFAKRRAALTPTTNVSFVVFNVRLDRTTVAWADMMFQTISSIKIACSLDVYVENIFDGLRGVCVIIGVSKKE